MPRCHTALLSLLLFTALNVARGELVWPDYNQNHPLKIMAAGDSITDDCVVNGAWRIYLQTLLETNGYAFTFVGRQSSVATADFTKTSHEGYCGAVIAPPGMLTYAVHGYAGTDVYLQKTLSDALTNITPDLVLVLVGANDIGRGRDPGVTATNDILNLLDRIFSNAPAANVILTKISAMQNASNIGGLNYGTYAGNVPIYNACLQRVVNQRHDAGQNVFLADMFSVVDPATMLNPDHLHPNAAGLRAIAGEWLTRIQSITSQGDAIVSVLVKGGDNWKYSDTGVDLGTNWMRPDYDDGGWSSGPGRLGYGDQEALTTISYGPVATNKYPTTYFRHSFVVPANTAYTNLVLRLSQQGGAVVWLNGQELWRTNLPAGLITYTNLALTQMVGSYTPYAYNPVSVDAAKLLPGTNVIAVAVHQFRPAFPTLGFDMELIGAGNLVAAPALSLAQSGTNVVLTWPAASGGGFGLYSSGNLATTNWTPPNVLMQTNGGQISVTQSLESGAKFFRLQKP